LDYFLEINFLHFALFLFLFCSAVLMIVSKLSTTISEKSLELVTFQKNKTLVTFKWTTDVILSIVLPVLVLLLWAIFSPIGVG